MSDTVSKSVDQANSILATSRGNLASRVRHDLLQPLAAMKLLLARLGDDVDADERKAVVDTFAAAVDGVESSLKSVVQHLFFQNDVMQRDDAQIDLDRWLEALVEPYIEKIRAAGLSFEFNAEAGVVSVDEDLLEIVVLSAVDNAFDFTSDGGIAVSAARFGDQILITVSDTGCGVAENAINRLAQPFYLENADKARGASRLGLGLSNARDAATLLGGAIDLEPQPGGGAKFTFMG